MALNRSQLIKTSQKTRQRSGNKYGLLPVYVENAEDPRNLLIKSSRGSREKTKLQPLISSRIKQKPQKKILLSKLSSTVASTFNITNRISHRVMSSDEKFRSTYRPSCSVQQKDNFVQRPSTEFKNHRNFEVKQRLAASTPLEVVNTKLSEDKMTQKAMNMVSSQIVSKSKRSLSQILEKFNYSSQSKINMKSFLKKGTSFQRTLLHNILKSKLKQKLAFTSLSYFNHIPNTLLHSKIKRQIPNQFRDIIGPEETLRMSRILSGINIKTIDMNQKIKEQISKRLIKQKIKTIDSVNDDLQTLKSIKRW